MLFIVIYQGLEYIHGSRLKVHGRLKSSNVIIDGRWVCKLTDFGLITLTAGQEHDSETSRDSLFSSKLNRDSFYLFKCHSQKLSI
jgi:serine/threonine protein kinase